jgi:hypothetical protein
MHKGPSSTLRLILNAGILQQPSPSPFGFESEIGADDLGSAAQTNLTQTMNMRVASNIAFWHCIVDVVSMSRCFRLCLVSFVTRVVSTYHVGAGNTWGG